MCVRQCMLVAVKENENMSDCVRACVRVCVCVRGGGMGYRERRRLCLLCCEKGADKVVGRRKGVGVKNIGMQTGQDIWR